MGNSTARALVFCIILVQLFACQQAPQPLPVTELHFPDPERDALKVHGIRELVVQCKSPSACYNNPHLPHLDTSSILYYDSLGNLLHLEIINLFGRYGMDFWYNKMGWKLIEYQHNEHELYFHYHYNPEHRLLFQYLYRRPQNVQVRIWQFDSTGKPITCVSEYSRDTFQYDSLNRLILEREVYSNVLSENNTFFPKERHTEYYYKDTTNLLTRKIVVELDTSGKQMQYSIVKTYDSSGLPILSERFDGQILHYNVHKTTYWERDTSATQFFPAPYNQVK